MSDDIKVRIINQVGPPAPPCATPMFPADIAENERIVVRPPIPAEVTAGAANDQQASVSRTLYFSARAKEDDRFWVIKDASTHSLAARWLNDPGPGLSRRGFGYGLGRIDSPMVWQLYRRRANVPDFSGNSGWPFVTDRLLKILLEEAPDGIVHKPVHLLAPDGSLFSDQLHVIDVLTCVDAVDYANSQVSYLGEQRHGGTLYPRRVGYIDYAAILKNLGTPPHIFRQRMPTGVNPGSGTLIVSKHLRERIRKELHRPSNFEFMNFFGLGSTII